MSRTKKKLLGLLGLFIVAAVTTLAVFLPQRGVFATSSATDTVTITVKANKARIGITSPTDGERVKGPSVTFGVSHEELTGGRIIVERTSKGGGKQTINFESDGRAGDYSQAMNLEERFPENFGYGTYKVTAEGDAHGVSSVVKDAIEFTYNALNPGGNGNNKPGGDTDPNKPGNKYPGLTVDPETGNPEVDPGVDPNNPHVDHAHVKVIPTGGEGEQPGGNTDPFLENDVPNGETWVVPFAENCPEAGWYYILMEAVDAEGNVVGEPEEAWFYWAAGDLCAMPVANTGAPNTGGLFSGKNIAREDALITGAIVFVVAAGLGMFFVVRKKATRKNRK